MSSDEEFLQRLRAAFVEEGSEILQATTDALLDLALEVDYQAQINILSRILSSLHTLKGSARAVSDQDIVSVCQSIESLTSQLKQMDQNNLPRALMIALDPLTEVIDNLNKLIIGTDQGLKDALDIKLAALNHKLTGLTTDEPKPDKPEPAPQPKVTEPSITQMQQMETGTFNVSELRSIIAASKGEALPQSIYKPSRSEVIPDTTVRVQVDRLDKLLLASEELLLLKAQLGQRLEQVYDLKEMIAKLSIKADPKTMEQTHKEATRLYRQTARDASNAALMISQFLDTAKTLTMQPMTTTLEVFPRLVRDLCRELKKECDLTVEGAHIEIDRRILERLKEPLLHIMRNALDHGIENPEAREHAGKPRKAKMELIVKQLSLENLEILVTDDGAGVNARKVRQKALDLGLISKDEADTMSYAQSLGLIFRPDFSTRDEVSELSGRGIGLSIVKEKIEELAGRLEIASTEGAGTTFKIVLPTKMATFAGIMVEASVQNFVIPVAGLVRAMRVHPLALEMVEGRRTFFVDGKLIPIAHLSQALSINAQEAKSGSFKFLEILVVQSRERTAGIIVDHVLDQREFLVKKPGYPLQNLTNFSGATILTTGATALVIDIHQLVETVHHFKSSSKPQDSLLAGLLDSFEDKDEATVTPDKSSILLVEDSITSRVLLKNIFESAGYTVQAANNGEEGLRALRHGHFSAVVSDVEMPVMDGLEMTRRIKGDAQLKTTPVILVTSLSSERDRKNGSDAGADAYFVKGDLDSTGLLEMVRKLT